MRGGNLLDDVAKSESGERFETLSRLPAVRIERIVSNGEVSPAGFWYDQDDDEWLTVIAGEARLEIDGETEVRNLRRGDWILLPAHCRHRVAWTSDEGPTVWLAVHIDRPSS